MNKERFQVTIHPDLVKLAHSDMEREKFSSFSEYLEALIRAEWKRREGKPTATVYPVPTPRTDTLNEPKPRKHR